MNKMNSHLLVFISVLSLTSCASFKDFEGTPSIDGLEETKTVELGNERFKAVETVANWWKTLQDEQLSVLIDKSQENNKDVTVALANLQEARGIAREAGFGRYPTVTASGSGSRTRTSGELGNGASRTSNNYNAGFDASWELDLYGRVSEGIKANVARAQAAQANLRDVYVTISSEVARTYIELRGAQYRLDIAQRNTANQEETLELTKKLTNGGRGTRLDVSRAHTQLELTRSTIPTLDSEVTAYIHRLSVLTGQVPNALRLELTAIKPMPTIPASVNVGDVSGLLQRRPDIAIAESNLKAAVAEYNVSIADQFPQINIIGALGFAATNLTSFGSSAVVGSFGPSVNWSIFDMGRVKARITQSDARAQAAVAYYEKTVLIALEELQTSVSNFSMEEERRERLQNAARFAKEASELANIRYKGGIDTFIDVLSAEAVLLQAEDTLAKSEIRMALNLIAVYKALGGGWEFNN